MPSDKWMELYKQTVCLDSQEGVITQDALVTVSAHPIANLTRAPLDFA